ncbi:MAG TPA: glycosyltransferase family 1 protein [Solirubrobacteraceae bacterium]
MVETALGGAVTRPSVVIDARIVDADSMTRTGLGRYTSEVVCGLRLARPHWDLVVLSNRRDLFGAPPAIRRTRWPTASGLGRVTWLQAVSRLELARLRPDLWFGTAYVVPWWWKGASVVTVHDLVFLTMPARYRGRLNAAHASWATRSSVARARTVICDSAHTRGALMEVLDVPSDRLEVVHLGVSEAFRPGGPRRVADPYLLQVGTFEARKGLDTLADALVRLRAEGSPLRAVLAGRPGWGAETDLRRLEELGAEIVVSPDDAELAELYRGALAVTLLSREEGFGLTAAEAMASGTPLVCTDLPAVREFAGSAPLYANPGDSVAVAGHLRALLEDPAERRRRAVLGLDLSRELDWARVAERHAEIIERHLP